MSALLVALVLRADPTLLECPAKESAIVVSTSDHRMVLCEGGAVVHGYDVAIGSGGPAPKRVGWAQAPLGRFTLKAPIRSSQFHVFVPLENPDAKRFAAWAIGLHGPMRGFEKAGRANVETDWTLGCIAVSSDEEIDEVAAWVRQKKVQRVDFR